MAKIASRGTEMVEVDEIDRKILRALQDDARASFKNVGKSVGVSEATVFVRVKKLQERGVLRGFKAVVDPKSVGKTLTAIMLIRAQPRSLVGMLDALKKLDDIYEIYDVTGQYYSILKIRTDSTEQLSKIIDEIGMIDGVAGTETVIVLRTVKEELGLIL
jgi:Lrp/AsnC family transcriptional regulator, regulator for asnA, asnC and gidA